MSDRQLVHFAGGCAAQNRTLAPGLQTKPGRTVRWGYLTPVEFRNGLSFALLTGYVRQNTLSVKATCVFCPEILASSRVASVTALLRLKVVLS